MASTSAFSFLSPALLLRVPLALSSTSVPLAAAVLADANISASAAASLLDALLASASESDLYLTT
jgi:hypothetical protein